MHKTLNLYTRAILLEYILEYNYCKFWFWNQNISLFQPHMVENVKILTHLCPTFTTTNRILSLMTRTCCNKNIRKLMMVTKKRILMFILLLTNKILLYRLWFHGWWAKGFRSHRLPPITDIWWNNRGRLRRGSGKRNRD